jgi:murein DD-endopeptidase MepM/ murein hydrolase activator NlpD
MTAENINKLLVKHQHEFAAVVDFNLATEKIIPLNFTASNTALTTKIVNDTLYFSEYIVSLLADNLAKYGVGGYMEERTVYARSEHFNTEEGEPRRLHLGVDIWGAANTPIYAFMDAKVHSFAFNDHFGDYGATIILEHSLDGNTFYSLYGHLSLKSLDGLNAGKIIEKGKAFCEFGIAEENGHWPPHLHFQLMTDLEGKEGDYPGVAKISEKELWKKKIPDANLVLNWSY